jgi:hypothetical protein
MDDFIVTLKPGANVEKTRRELEAAGLKSPQFLEAMGVLTGQADSATEEKLRAVEGVDAVERDQKVQLPPPDSPLH